MDEQTVERALDWMMDNTSKLAKATADRKYIEDYKKVKFSTLFVQAQGKTIADKEAWSYAHADYIGVLEGLRVAVQEESELRHYFTTAEAKIEVWRTLQANHRAGIV